MENNIFNSVRIPTPPSSKFNMTHSHRLSMKMGNITPFFFEECAPGDYWSLKADALVRLAPLQTPVMEMFDVKIEFFFVAYRLLWNDFEEWITGQSIRLPPSIDSWGGGIDPRPIEIGSLHDYLGVVPEIIYDVVEGNDPNAFGHLAYQKIWFDWYRDQNHQFEGEDWFKQWQIQAGNELLDITNDGINNKWCILRKRAWTHDYFTSALPWAQKGSAVLIPFGQYADVPVYTDPDEPIGTVYRRVADNDPMTAAAAAFSNAGGPVTASSRLGNFGDLSYINAEQSGFMARTSELITPSPTINELRRAEAIQKWLERNARAGTRYKEHVLANFGENTKDSRLDRAEMIGMQSAPIIVSEVLQTATTAEGTLGDMGGRAITATDGQYYTYKCREHGCIIGNITIMPRAAYYQGMNKKFWRKSHFDYPQPLLAQIGEQAIENRELYMTGSGATGRITWGYQSRYADWKYAQSRISGDFRISLDDWHYARKFASLPGLNEDFLTYSNDNRIFAVTEDIDNCYAQILILSNVDRKLPFYGTPTN